MLDTNKWVPMGDCVYRACITGKEANIVKHWCALRDELLSNSAISHWSVKKSYGSKWGELQSVDVDDDFLEKDMAGWWSEDELRTVLALHGRVARGCFRPYFLPVLQAVMDELHNHRATLVQNAVSFSDEAEPVADDHLIDTSRQDDCPGDVA